MISVCLAAYNGEKMIEKQLRSIVDQLSEQDEVIIVDDESSDQTVACLKQFAQTTSVPLLIIENTKNLGPVKSFERALSTAKGEIIFLSDQDDEWFPDKVSAVMQAFADKKVQLVVHDAKVITIEGKVLAESWNQYNSNHLQQGIFGNLIKNAYTGSMMAFRSSLVQASLPFPKQLEMHDQWFFLVAKRQHMKIVTIAEPLMYYIRHVQNVTGKRRNLNVRLKGRYNMLKCIVSYKKERSTTKR